MNRKKIALLLGVMVVLALLLALLGAGPKLVRAQGSTIRIALDTDPATFDPTTPGYNNSSRFVAAQIYESLFRYTPDGSIEPAGATGSTVTPDGLVYTISLRQGTYWSDGELVVAQHYIDGMLHLGGSSWAYLLDAISGFSEWSDGTNPDPDDVGIVAIDDYTLQITLTSPAAYFPHILATPFVKFPVRLIDSDDPKGAIMGPEVVNGPYRLVDWLPEDHITLVKNNYYWNSSEVEIEEIQLPIMPDLSAQLTAYENDELDVSRYPWQDLPYVQADPVLSAELRRISTPGIYYIGLNTFLDPTDDLDLRIALASAIDREAILNDLFVPWREPATGVIPQGMLGYQGDAVGYNYNLVTAQSHLDAYMTTAGIGLPSDIHLELWSNTQNPDIPDMVADMWMENLGVDVVYTTWAWQDYLDKLDDCSWTPTDPTCGYNAYRLGWIVDYLEPWNILNDLFHPDHSKRWE